MAKQAPTTNPNATLDLTIGILTYQRPDSLVATLDSLVAAGALTGSDHGDGGSPSGYAVDEVLVIDNDQEPTAADAVAEWVRANGLAGLVRHVHEPSPGLAAARNRALDEATTPVLVFIDDDEQAEPGWPGGLVSVMQRTGAAMVGGPVHTRFDHEPPSWVTEGGHFERVDPAHEARTDWLRSGNLAIDLTQTRPAGLRFDQRFAFSGGEDVAFTKAAVGRGLELRWSTEGSVTEVVGPERTTPQWVRNRARHTTAAYVRAHPAEERTVRWRASMAARAAYRLARGGATVVVGAMTLHYGRVLTGVTQLHRGYGFLEGLMGRPGDAYGSGHGK
ncbi:MAG: glycosyltransferase family 2 protein [Actinomycetota bacterium]